VISLSVCLSVHEYISGTAVIKFFVQIPCGRDLVLLWRRCDTLCTPDITDDVMFGHNGQYGTSGVAIPGRSLMSINSLLIFDIRVLWRSVCAQS